MYSLGAKYSFWSLFCFIPFNLGSRTVFIFLVFAAGSVVPSCAYFSDNLGKEFSWSSVSMGSRYVNAANHRLKVFRNKKVLSMFRLFSLDNVL